MNIQRRDLDYLFVALGEEYGYMKRVTKRINEGTGQHKQLLMYMSRILQNQWLIMKTLELTCTGTSELKQALFESGQWLERHGFYDHDLSRYIEQGAMNNELEQGSGAE